MKGIEEYLLSLNANLAYNSDFAPLDSQSGVKLDNLLDRVGKQVMTFAEAEREKKSAPVMNKMKEV